MDAFLCTNSPNFSCHMNLLQCPCFFEIVQWGHPGISHPGILLTSHSQQLGLMPRLPNPCSNLQPHCVLAQKINLAGSTPLTELFFSQFSPIGSSLNDGTNDLLAPKERWLGKEQVTQSTELCHPKVVFQQFLIQQVRYQYQSIFILSDCQVFKRKMRTYSNVHFSCSWHAEHLSSGMHSGLQGKEVVTIFPCWGSPPHFQLSIRSSKLTCQLIWQRLNFQSNQKTMYIVCFNWLKLGN